MTTPISYNYDGAVAALGLKSDWALREAVRTGHLSPRFPNSKTPLFDHDELKAWFRSLPVDRPVAS